MDVYPSSRTVWFGILLFGGLALIAVVSAAVAVANGPTRSDWWLLIALAIFPWATWRSIGQHRHPLRFAHLDEEAMDCALGRVPWRSVASARVAWHWGWAGKGSHPSRRLFLDLRDPAEAPTPTTREYLAGVPFGGPIESDAKIRLPLWGSREKVLGDVDRYATG